MKAVPSRRNKQTLGRGNDNHFPRLLGGRLCLDFVNTLDARLQPTPTEFLPDYPAMARWGYHLGLYDLARRDELLALAAQQSGEAEAIHTRAIALREALFRVLLAHTQSQAAETTDLDLIRDTYALSVQQATLTSGPNGYHWTWPDGARLGTVLWDVVRSAVDLLTSPELGRVKECRGCDDCGSLFLDSSRNGTRQWCSMEGCGSRAKMRRHYRRTHAPHG